MADKGSKRTMQARAPPAKKAKADPQLDGIIEAIQQADLPESCKNMLIAAVPNSFGIPSDLRHDVQHHTVKMIGGIVDGVHISLQQAIDATADQVKAVEATKAELAQKLSDAEASLASATKDVKASTAKLAGFYKVMVDKRTRLADAREAQSKGDASFVAAKSQKESHETAVENHLKALLSDDVAAEQGKVHYKALSSFVTKLRLEDSFKQALPSVVSKSGSERSQFDTMVLQQLNERFIEHIADLTKQIEEGAPVSVQYAAAVTAAETEFASAKDEEQVAARELAGLITTQKEAEACVVTAKKAVTEHNREHKKITGSADQKKQDLENFEVWNIACFTTLRDQIAPKPEVMEDTKVAETEEAAAETVSAAGA